MMTTFVERLFSGTVPWKVGEYEHENRGRFGCRPAGRAGTDQKDDYVCTGVRISFFLSFHLPSLSTSCLLKKTHVYVPYVFSSRSRHM